MDYGIRQEFESQFDNFKTSKWGLRLLIYKMRVIITIYGVIIRIK